MAGLGIVLAMLVSTAILIPIFVLRQLLSTRPGEWWYFGVSFVVGFLVFLVLFSIGGGNNDAGFNILIASGFGALMSMFGVLWHKIGIGYPRTEPRSSAVALHPEPDETVHTANDGFSKGWLLAILGILIAQAVFVMIITNEDAPRTEMEGANTPLIDEQGRNIILVGEVELRTPDKVRHMT
jgi:hypothetical protein